MLFSDVRACEAFSCSCALRLLAESENDFLSSHDLISRQKIRQQAIVLAFSGSRFDNSHFIATFKSLLSSAGAADSSFPLATVEFQSADARAEALLKLLVKCAAHSQSARGATRCALWLSLQHEELHAQLELERAGGLILTSRSEAVSFLDADVAELFVLLESLNPTSQTLQAACQSVAAASNSQKGSTEATRA